METPSVAMQVVEDRISALPDELIVSVLSFLNMEDAVPTSLLSKRWRYMWTFNPNLVFPSYSNFLFQDGKCSVAAINQCIQLYKAKLLHKLDIALHLEGDASKEIEEWINFAIHRQVQHLSVTTCQNDVNSILLLRFLVPGSLFSCESLQDLTLGGCDLYPLPSHIECIGSLKRLRLTSVKVFDVALQSLLSKCPHLISLTLGDLLLDVEYFIISMPHLLDLYISCSLKWVEIDAPNLQLFTCDGSIYTRFTVKNAPNLLKLNLNFSTSAPLRQRIIFWGSTMESFSHVNILRLNHRLLELICAEYDIKGRRITFNNLKEFHLKNITPDSFSIYSLASFLRCCPSIKEVHIAFDDSGDSSTQALVDERSLSSEFGSFFLDHLKLVKMSHFTNCVRKMELVRFLLEKACLLDKLIIQMGFVTTSDHHDFLKKIFAFPKTSANATIVPPLEWWLSPIKYSLD